MSSEECTCHLHPPCHFCQSLTEEEADIYANEGMRALRRFRNRVTEEEIAAAPPTTAISDKIQALRAWKDINGSREHLVLNSGRGPHPIVENYRSNLALQVFLSTSGTPHSATRPLLVLASCHRLLPTCPPPVMNPSEPTRG